MPRIFKRPTYNLEKRAPRVYRAVANLGPHPEKGTRWREARTFRGTRDDALQAADAWFEELRRRAEHPDLAGRAEQPLSAYLESWLESKRGTIKETAWRRYESLLRTSVTPALGHIRLCDLSPQHLRAYLASCREEPSGRHRGPNEAHPDRVALPVSPKTVQNRLGALSPALRQAVREGLIAANPLDCVDRPRVSRTLPQIVGEIEAAKILRAAEGSDLEPIIRLALGTGARLGELLGLRWSDIDFERGIVQISRTLVARNGGGDWYYFDDTKGGRGRAVDVDRAQVEALRAHRREQNEIRLALGPAWCDLDLVFPNTWQLRNVAPGAPLRPTTISRMFRKLADDAGLEGVRFHDMRHAAASIALRAGTAPHVVAQRLGHTDVALTLRIYSHCLPGQQRGAAEAVAAAIEKAMSSL